MVVLSQHSTPAIVTILMTDSHASLFIDNTLVILAEHRANVAVHTPKAFVKITFAAAT